jgi:hypothetical protein
MGGRTLGSLETSGLGVGGLDVGGDMGYLGSSGRLDNMNGGSCAQQLPVVVLDRL